MKTIELGSYLFSEGKRQLNFGLPIYTGINASSKTFDTFSNKRPANAINAASKISKAVRLFEKFIDLVPISAYENDPLKSVYIEIEGRPMLIKNNEIRCTMNDKYETEDYMLASLIYELSQFGDNIELKQTFHSIMDRIKNGLNNYSPTNTAIFESLLTLFCDSFYYGYAKDTSLCVLDDLSLEEIEAGFRSGAFEIHGLLGLEAEDYLVQSKFEKSKKKTKTKKSATDFVQKIKNGDFRISYNWGEKQKMHIQPVSFLDNFVVSEQFESILRKIKHRMDKTLTRLDAGMEYLDVIGNDYVNLLMVGKPGTGKTTLAYALSAATGLPVYTEAISHNTDETAFSGVTTIVDGKPSFCETDFLNAYTNGGIIVLEEINLAQPSVMMGGLGQAIEYPFIIKENGYKDVRRHPLCIIIGTMNVGTAGSKQLNAAFANRFHQVYTLNDPTRESLVDVLVKRTTMDKSVCEWVYGAYEETVRLLMDPDIDAECNVEDVIAGLSLRTCMGALECMEEGDSALDAISNSLIGSIALMDLTLAKNIERDLFGIISRNVPH